MALWAKVTKNPAKEAKSEISKIVTPELWYAAKFLYVNLKIKAQYFINF